MKSGSKSVFFAGGGTGGHIYPAIAVAEKIADLDPNADIHFFCSSRPIDSKILSKTKFKFTALPATGLSLKPAAMLRFFKTFFQSARITRGILSKSQNPVVVGIGGFVAAPVCKTAYKMGIPVELINTDITPGKANKYICKFAKNIFIQFDYTKSHFPKTKAKIHVVGCPLRSEFDNPDPTAVLSKFQLTKDKKILLITGASSGSESINRTICDLLPQLSDFAETWQIVHLTGYVNFENVKQQYSQTETKIRYRILDYCDDMAGLLKAADLVIGRSGAVSVAEYAAAAVPSICLPYPHHKDLHQYLNAGQLVDVGAAVIVDDVADDNDRTEWLWEELKDLMSDDEKRNAMGQNCKLIAGKNASLTIAKKLLEMD